MTDQPQAPVLDADSVAAYLRQHPEFFADYEELIPELRIPHQPGAAVSLVERQVRLLRERNIEMRQRLGQLMDVARDNDRLFDKTRRLVLALLDSQSLEESIGAVEDSLRHEFQIPFVSLILLSDKPLDAGRHLSLEEARKSVGGLINGGKPLCGSLRPAELEFLFGKVNALQIGSAAVVLLNHPRTLGILAVGHSDPGHYKSSLGTLFLSYLAEVISRTLARFI